MGLYGLTLGYDYLSLKAPMEKKKKHLWWKQLSHAKNNQSNNTRNLGWLPYEQCHYVITF